jgi:hypothetical protein
MTLSQYEMATARTGEFKVHDTVRITNNENVGVTKTYLQYGSACCGKNVAEYRQNYFHLQ